MKYMRVVETYLEDSNDNNDKRELHDAKAFSENLRKFFAESERLQAEKQAKQALQTLKRMR